MLFTRSAEPLLCLVLVLCPVISRDVDILPEVDLLKRATIGRSSGSKPKTGSGSSPSRPSGVIGGGGSTGGAVGGGTVAPTAQATNVIGGTSAGGGVKTTALAAASVVETQVTTATVINGRTTTIYYRTTTTARVITSSNKKPSSGKIACIVIGVLVGVILLALVVFCVVKGRRARGRQRIEMTPVGAQDGTQGVDQYANREKVGEA